MEDAETYKKMLARDERRFRVADQDGDLMATREELTAFLHPEEFPHMRDIVIAVSDCGSWGPALGAQGDRSSLRKGRCPQSPAQHPERLSLGPAPPPAVGGPSLPPLTPLHPPQETLEDLDTNKDGFVQVEEYIGEWPCPQSWQWHCWRSRTHQALIRHLPITVACQAPGTYNCQAELVFYWALNVYCG